MPVTDEGPPTTLQHHRRPFALLHQASYRLAPERAVVHPDGVPAATIHADLDRAADETRGRYGAAAPWPHAVLDGLFDDAVVGDAYETELAGALALRPHRSNRQVKAESSTVSGASAAALLRALGSGRFVRFVEQLTGVPSLIVDPTHWWAGLHVQGSGSFQSIHRDFARHGPTGLYHRVNALLYLTPQWRPAYGGQLELWDRAATRCVESIEPRAGRLVVFETTPASLHAVRRVACPDGMARLVLVAYFYSVDPGPHRRRTALHVRLPRRPGDPIWSSVAVPADPLRRVFDGVSAMRRRAPRL